MFKCFKEKKVIESKKLKLIFNKSNKNSIPAKLFDY